MKRVCTFLILAATIFMHTSSGVADESVGLCTEDLVKESLAIKICRKTGFKNEACGLIIGGASGAVAGGLAGLGGAYAMQLKELNELNNYANLKKAKTLAEIVRTKEKQLAAYEITNIVATKQQSLQDPEALKVQTERGAAALSTEQQVQKAATEIAEFEKNNPKVVEAFETAVKEKRVAFGKSAGRDYPERVRLGRRAAQLGKFAAVGTAAGGVLGLAAGYALDLGIDELGQEFEAAQSVRDEQLSAQCFQQFGKAALYFQGRYQLKNGQRTKNCQLIGEPTESMLGFFALSDGERKELLANPAFCQSLQKFRADSTGALKGSAVSYACPSPGERKVTLEFVDSQGYSIPITSTIDGVGKIAQTTYSQSASRDLIPILNARASARAGSAESKEIIAFVERVNSHTSSSNGQRPPKIKNGTDVTLDFRNPSREGAVTKVGVTKFDPINRSDTQYSLPDTSGSRPDVESNNAGLQQWLLVSEKRDLIKAAAECCTQPPNSRSCQSLPVETRTDGSSPATGATPRARSR